MHTRRVGAFLIGAYLLGSLLMAFWAAQSYTNVDRFFSNPPPQVSKELDDVGPDVMRQILRFHASQNNRYSAETWEVAQLGILGALLATSFLTSHRSRIVIICASLMVVMALVAYLYLTPIMNALSRAFDFLPAGASVPERENYSYYSLWYRALDVIKGILAFVVAGRLLFDRAEWRDKLLPAAPGKGLRRRRRSRPLGPATSEGNTSGEINDLADAETPTKPAP